jgi:type IV pilus assembly protein PilM
MAIEYFGLDFGHASLKAVELTRGHDLVSFGSVPTPPGSLGSENDDQKNNLVKAVKSLVKDLNIHTKKAIVSIPESFVSSRLIQVPYVDENQLDEAIHWQAKQYIPVPLDEVNMSYRRIGESYTSDGVKQWNIFLVAVSKLLIEYYIGILKRAELEPLAIETQSAAIARSVSRDNDKTSSLIIDFGHDSVTLAIVKNLELIYSQSIPTGSNALTKAIAQDFSLELSQAEEYKKSYGLDETQLDGRIFRSLKPVIDAVTSEVTRAIDYFKVNAAENIPTKVVLVGEGSYLPGLVIYLTQKLGLEVQLGNPWVGVHVADPSKLPPLSPSYAAAIGLAMKDDEI